jgi:alpha-beta hydrolase superfamily lysophospholipase
MHYLRFDLRGHGRTLSLNPKRQKACHLGSFNRIFLDLNDMIEHLLIRMLNIKSIILFGHSMGALLALEYTREIKPTLVTHLILSGTTTYTTLIG